MTSSDTPFTRQAIRWLTEPHPAIRDPEDRRRVRVLSTLLLVATLVSALGYVILSGPGGQQHYRRQFLINSIPVTVAYLLSRTRYYKVTPTLACLLPAVGVFAGVLAMQNGDPTYINQALMWLFVPILLSGLVLSVRGTALTSGLILAALAATIELAPELSGKTSGMVFGFIFSIASMTLVVAGVYQQNLARLKKELGERIKTEAALAASERRWRSVAQTAADAIIIFNRQREIVSWNDAAQAMFGYTEQEAVGKTMALLLPPEQAHQLPDMIKRIRQQILTGSHSPPHITLESMRKDGGHFPCELTVAVWESNGDKYYTGILRDISERHQIEGELRASIQEKEVMLKEIHHRVKNNLQIISSLLSLQSSTIEDKEANAVLKESQNRVRSMALIHEKLYQSNMLSRIKFSEYIQGLTTYLIPAYEQTGHVTFHIEADDVWLSLDAAVPCGLIVNELISNALKYAFPDGKPGRIELSASAEGDLIKLVATDNGVGIPAGKDILDGNTLGLQLVHSLVGQLEGELHISGTHGTRFEITFRDPIGRALTGSALTRRAAVEERPRNTAIDNAKKSL
jgi:PAS domain S-box-containing protein